MSSNLNSSAQTRSLTGYNVRSKSAALLNSGANYLANKAAAASASASSSRDADRVRQDPDPLRANNLDNGAVNHSNNFNQQRQPNLDHQSSGSSDINMDSSSNSSYQTYRPKPKPKRQSSIDLLKKPIRNLHTSATQSFQSTGPSSGLFSSSSASASSSTTATATDPSLIHPVLLPGYCLSKVARDRKPQGWASVDPPEDLEDGEVELEVFIQGFVGRDVERGKEGRTQRLFAQMARRLSGLPNLPTLTENQASNYSNSASTSSSNPTSVPDPIILSDSNQSMSLSDRLSAKVADHADEATLLRLIEGIGALPVDKNHEPRKNEDSNGSMDPLDLSSEPPHGSADNLNEFLKGATDPSSSSDGYRSDLPKRRNTHESIASGANGASHGKGGSLMWSHHTLEEIQSLSKNLDERLRAFWTYREEGREVRIEIRSNWQVEEGEEKSESLEKKRLLAATTLTSDSTGQFFHKLIIPWHMLDKYRSTDPDPSIRNSHPSKIKSLELRAVLIPKKAAMEAAKEWAEESGLFGGKSNPEMESTSKLKEISTEWETFQVQEDDSRSVRLISDVDDTVKETGVTSGVKQVFRNVFVKHYHDVIVPGIGDFYTKLFESQVGIHYVSNAPLELHGIVRSYLKIAGLPIGHMHLKHYPSGGRPLLSSWLQPAGDRKRHGLLSILDNFPKSNFLLIGDSGEMDLELYSDLAKERPGQIRAIFIRDVSTPEILRNGNYGRNGNASGGGSGSGGGNGFGLGLNQGEFGTGVGIRGSDEMSSSVKPTGWDSPASTSASNSKISALTSIQPPPQAHTNNGNTNSSSNNTAFTTINSSSISAKRSPNTTTFSNATFQDPLSYSDSEESNKNQPTPSPSSSSFFLPYPPPRRSLTSLSSSSASLNSNGSASSIIPKARALGSSASASTQRLFRTGSYQSNSNVAEDPFSSSSSNSTPSNRSSYSPNQSRQNSIGGAGGGDGKFAPLPEGVTDSDLKRYHSFLDRVREAEKKIPRSTILRFFREAKDFREEAEKIVRELKKGTRPVDR